MVKFWGASGAGETSPSCRAERVQIGPAEWRRNPNGRRVRPGMARLQFGPPSLVLGPDVNGSRSRSPIEIGRAHV